MNENRVRELLRAPYTRMLAPDTDTGRFSGRILEFSGCFAEGDTLEEAARNLERAAEAWLEAVLARGQPVPNPSGETDFSGRFVVRLPRSLHRQCALFAEQEGVSLNQFVAYALGTHVGQRSGRDATVAKLEATLEEVKRRVAKHGVY